MSLHATLPHWFLVVVIIVVAWFVLKSLIKFAILIGAVGLVIYLLWVLGYLGGRGNLVAPF
jgi:diacylglycerol kinase